MSIFDYSGDKDFFSAGSICPNPKEGGCFLSPGHHVDVYFSPCKRSRITAPFIVTRERLGQKQQPSIEVLPDECLFEIFRRLHGSQERGACASVSKRWLLLLSTIQREEISVIRTHQPLEPEERSISSKSNVIKKRQDDGSGGKIEDEAENQEIEDNGSLSRYLEGKKATDIRLASIAVGACSRGGLGKLSIRGNNSSRSVTNVGLKAIARGCPSLRVLSLWNVNSIGDEGLFEIASGCHQLGKLDLCKCPAISDKALVAIAENCPNLTSLTLESCTNISNEGLQAVSRCCPNLKSISIKNCPLIGDQGIASLFSSSTCALTKVKLQALNISDVSLAVIGHYGMAVTDMTFSNLQMATERGFWVMGNCKCLKNLRTFAVTSCQGITDLGLEAIGRGCPILKKLVVGKCGFLSDNGLVSFIKAQKSLESLQLEECHRITQSGVFVALVNGGKLKALTLRNCLGTKNVALGFPLMSSCSSLLSLSICNCPGFGDASLAILGRLCPNLVHIDLSGLQGITNDGVLALIENRKVGLERVNLVGSVNLTDNLIVAIAKLHGGTLELLNLEGCKGITNASLVSIAENCSLLSELDVSKCAITDSGIATLACAEQLFLQRLSLASCSLLSDKSLLFLEKLGQTLMGLNIQNCRGMSSSKVDHLKEQLWMCDILS